MFLEGGSLHLVSELWFSIPEPVGSSSECIYERVFVSDIKMFYIGLIHLFSELRVLINTPKTVIEWDS